MPTTNPVPSTDPSDLLFNAGKLDEVVNGTANSFTDRLGATRRTVAGMNADFDAQLADAESDLNVYRADAAASAAEALGYLQTIRATSYGAYAEDPTTDPLGNPPTVGDEYFNTTANLLKRWNGTTWQASDINTANLAAPSGSSLVGYSPAGTGAVATTVQAKLRGTVISVYDFMSDAQRTDAMSATPTVDCTAAVQAAVNHALSLPGRVTIEGYGLCVIGGTVNFTHGGQRKPIYFTRGGYKKINSGNMFSASVDNSGDVYFDNVYFESIASVGTRVFSTDYIIRLHTTNCVFKNCDYVWYSGDDVSVGFAYTQSCRSIGDTVTGGVGYAFDLASAFDCVWDNLTLESRENGIRVRGTGQGVHSGRVVNSAIEGLTGTAIRIDMSALSLQIENNYFENNAVGHIVFGSTTVQQSVVIRENYFAGPDDTTNADSAIVWGQILQNVESAYNNALNITLHDVTNVTAGSFVWSTGDRSGKSGGIATDISKLVYSKNGVHLQSAVSGKTVTTTYLGQFQRITVQETQIVPNAVTTDYTVDFGVTIRTDDFVSIQCNTTADVRLLKYRKSGNTIIYTVRNDTGSAQSTTFTICVLKPYFSVIG